MAPTSPDRIDIWQIALDQPTASLSLLLSPDEQSRASRFLYPRDRDRYIVAHAALRGILALHLAVAPASLVFSAEENGKPCLEGHPVRFNLTHAGSLALVAVSPIRRLGIDLEPIRDLADALALAEHFHPNELASLRLSHPNPRAFFECWTRKEAFVKATGQGLTTPLDSFEVTFHPDPNPTLKIDGRPVPNWHLMNLEIPNHAAAFVVEALPNQPGPTIHLQTWQPA